MTMISGAGIASIQSQIAFMASSLQAGRGRIVRNHIPALRFSRFRARPYYHTLAVASVLPRPKA